MPVDIATGVLGLHVEETFVPGKVALTWERRYSTAFSSRPTMALGRVWTNRYYATLTTKSDGFEFVTPEGAVQFVANTDRIVERGGRAIDFGAFLEVFRDGEHDVVQRWDIDTGEVRRYRFARAPHGGISRLRSLDDVTGQGLNLSWDEQGRLSSVRQRLEKRSLVVSHGAHGFVETVSLQGPRGDRHLLARYEYDTAGRLVSASDAAGAADRYEYEDDRLVREIARDGGVFHYRYDRKGRCVRSSGLDRYDEKTLRYLDAARVTEVTDSVGGVRRYQRLPSGQVAVEINPVGAIEKKTYDDHGRIIAIADPTGGITGYRYDDAGNRCGVTYPDGTTYTLTFNDAHLPLTLVDPEEHVWQRAYDERNRVVATTDPLGAQYKFVYDSSGNLGEIVSPLGQRIRRQADFAAGWMRSTDWSGNETTVRFNDFNRVIEKTGPLGDTTRIVHDLFSNPVKITYPDQSEVAFTYDAGHNLTRFTNPRGASTEYRYGPCRRLLEKQDELGRVIRFEWDSEPGRLKAIQNEKGETHHFLRDEAGRVISETYVDSRRRSYDYDPAGRRVAVTTGDDKVTFSRDSRGRMIGFKSDCGTSATFAYDPLGRLVSAENADCSIRLVRDSLGRVVKELQDEDWVANRFDAVGNLLQTTTSRGGSTEYAYDDNGLLTAITDQAGGVTRLIRNARGQVVSRDMPGDVRLRQDYDLAGRLAGQTLSRGTDQSPRTGAPSAVPSSTMVSRRYTYDAAGLLRSLTDHVGDAWQFDYDAAERLLRAAHSSRGVDEFEYDPCDNLTAIARLDPKTGIRTVERLKGAPGNLVVSKGPNDYIYDAVARLSRKVEKRAESSAVREWRYQWDGLNQLRGVCTPTGERWTYRYDALGRRVGKEGPGKRVKYLWNQHVVQHELVEGSEPITWTFEPDGFVPLIKIERGQAYSVVVDHLGTPRELINGVGAVEWWAEYAPWGMCTSEKRLGTVGCPIRFQGQWFDEESGLHYNYHRYYDPALGRFISPDPLGITAGLNVFTYAPNPMAFIDPFGLASSNYFRGDDDHSKGDPMGLPIGSDAQRDAKIQTPWEHVHDKKTGDTSIFTSFSTDLKSTEKFGDQAFKVKEADLKALAADGKVIIMTPELVHALMENHPDPKVRKLANDTREAMQKNKEVLIVGEIPEEMIKKCK